MEGKYIKKLFNANNFKNNKKYSLEELPTLEIPLETLRKKLLERFDEKTCDYILYITYGRSSQQNIDPKKILDLTNIKNEFKNL